MNDVHSFLAPPPLSPLFQSEGVLEYFNEDVAETLLVMAILLGVDNLFVKRFIVPKVRYFFLHVLINIMSLVCAWPDVWRALSQDPRNCFSGSSHTMWANSAISALHVYHIVAFPLRFEDIMHHVIFVCTLCGLAIPYKHVGGIANNFGCFFLSGLPGAINYMLLVLVAHKKIDKKSEKKWCAVVNVWLRGPFMSVYGYIGWLSMYNGDRRDAPFAVALVVTVLHFVNGQYYAQQSVESYSKYMFSETQLARETKNDVNAKTS